MERSREQGEWQGVAGIDKEHWKVAGSNGDGQGVAGSTIPNGREPKVVCAEFSTLG